jgi:hypothetical protein
MASGSSATAATSVSDCVQAVIALIITQDGFPLAYEVMDGNTSDKTTLKEFLAKFEKQYGRAKRTWVMDCGIPTEDVLAVMRNSEPPVHHLVGSPRGRLTQLEKVFLTKPGLVNRPREVTPDPRAILTPLASGIWQGIVLIAAR